MSGIGLLGTLVLQTLLASSAYGQSGNINYERTVSLDVEVPREMTEMRDLFADRGRTTFSYQFGPQSSLMRSSQRAGETPPVGFRLTNSHTAAFLALAEAWSLSGENTLAQAYVDTERSSVVRMYESSSGTYRTERPIPTIDWQLTEDVREHLGFPVARATALANGARIEAWYAPDIAVAGGPAGFGGLPGMILVLTIGAGQTKYTATQISLGAEGERVIRVPNGGTLVSEQEHRSVLADEINGLRRGLREARRTFGIGAECAVRSKEGQMRLSCFNPRRGAGRMSDSLRSRNLSGHEPAFAEAQRAAEKAG